MAEPFLSFSRLQVVEAARTLLDTPYHPQGRKPGIGVDCVGFLACVADILNIPYQWIDNYAQQGNGDLLPILLQYGTPQGVITPGVGEVGVFFFEMRDRKPLAQHVGIFSTGAYGQRTLIHCYMSIGKVVEHTFDHYWNRRLMAVMRLHGCE